MGMCNVVHGGVRSRSHQPVFVNVGFKIGLRGRFDCLSYRRPITSIMLLVLKRLVCMDLIANRGSSKQMCTVPLHIAFAFAFVVRDRSLDLFVS